MGLFWGSYLLFLRNETHFLLNRMYLLAGLVSALLLPLVRIPREIVLTVSPQIPAAGTTSIQFNEASATLPWQEILLAGYIAGTSICLFLLARELWQLYTLVRTNPSMSREGFVFVPTSATEVPFSFFRYIFYNPEKHPASELPMILEHEKAHGAQYHSLDILLGRFVASLLWISPLSWWYQKSVEQNLEYLADAAAIERIPSPREYQYTLLKVSGNPLTPGLTTSFYSSLIKNRIVMLNSNPSKSIHKAKHLLILPVLALFLMAFAREDVYVIESPAAEEVGTPVYVQDMDSEKVIEFIINKGTTDEQLLEMKKKLAADEIDFSYTVARNSEGEIISLEFDFNGKAANGNPFSGSYASDSDGPIEPTLIRINDEGGIVFGNVDSIKESGNTFMHKSHSSDGKSQVWVYRSSDGDEDEVIEHRVKGGESVFVIEEEKELEFQEEEGMAKKIMVKIKEADVDTDADVKVHKIEVKKEGDSDEIIRLHTGKEHTKTVEIKEEDGKKIILVDGKEVSEDEWEESSENDGYKIERIRVRKSGKKDKDGHVMVIRDSDDDEDIEVISESGSGYFFIDNDGGAPPLYYVDGKKSNAKKVKGLDPDKIATIEFMKGEAALKKYGKKAKNGVVEITTKK